MAIKKESLKKLLIDLKVGDEKAVTELVESAEEKEVTLPDGTKVFSGDEYTKLLDNQKAEGIKIGKEVSIKDLKESTGLEFEGKKPESFLEAYKKKVIDEAGIKPDEKLKEKDAAITELRNKLKAEQSEREKATTEREAARRDAQLLGMFPQKRSTDLSDDDRLTLIKKRYEFVTEDGKEGVKDLRTGKFIQNDTLENLGWQNVIEKHFSESKWISEEGGEGGAKGAGFKDTKKVPGAINNMREFREHCTTQGWNIQGEEAQAKLAEVTKSNPDFNFNEV